MEFGLFLWADLMHSISCQEAVPGEVLQASSAEEVFLLGGSGVLFLKHKTPQTLWIIHS